MGCWQRGRARSGLGFNLKCFISVFVVVLRFRVAIRILWVLVGDMRWVRFWRLEDFSLGEVGVFQW